MSEQESKTYYVHTGNGVFQETQAGSLDEAYSNCGMKPHGFAAEARAFISPPKVLVRR